MFGPRPENSAPATMGPVIRASEPEAMFRPSMAPCWLGGVEREMIAEMFGMVRLMPKPPRAMITGVRAAIGFSTCSSSDRPKAETPNTISFGSPNRRTSRAASRPWVRVETIPMTMNDRPTSRACQPKRCSAQRAKVDSMPANPAV